MRFDCYLFDLDGTLTESEEGIIRSVEYALNKLGYAVPPYETLRRFIGPPLSDSFMRYCGMSIEEAEKAITAYRERFTTIGWKENSVYAGIPHMLRSLKKHGAYIALASSKPKVSCEKILRYFALEPLFDAISAPGWHETDAGKAEFVRRALPEGCDRARCCMVGDRLYDMHGAKANGITAVGTAYGYGGREELEAEGADIVFDDVASMTEWFLEGDAPANGVFISLEGSDGCGKTTQLTMLKDFLIRTGSDPLLTREPGGTPIAEKIRGIILDVENTGMSAACEALLYAASRAEHADKTIIPAVQAGRTVLSDRYVDSSVAYQGYARELKPEFIRQINSWATGRIMPDATIFLDMDPDAALRRRRAATEQDRLEQEHETFFRTVYKGYKLIASEEPDRIFTVNADQTPEKVHEDVQEAVRKILERQALIVRGE